MWRSKADYYFFSLWFSYFCYTCWQLKGQQRLILTTKCWRTLTSWTMFWTKTLQRVSRLVYIPRFKMYTRYKWYRLYLTGTPLGLYIFTLCELCVILCSSQLLFGVIYVGLTYYENRRFKWTLEDMFWCQINEWHSLSLFCLDWTLSFLFFPYVLTGPKQRPPTAKKREFPCSYIPNIQSMHTFLINQSLEFSFLDFIFFSFSSLLIFRILASKKAVNKAVEEALKNKRFWPNPGWPSGFGQGPFTV